MTVLPNLLLQRNKQNTRLKTKPQCLWHLINQPTYPSIIGRMIGEKAVIKDVQLQIDHHDARFVATTKTKYTHSRKNHILLITPNKSNDLPGYYQPHERGKSHDKRRTAPNQQPRCEVCCRVLSATHSNNTG